MRYVDVFEELFGRYHHRRFVHPDPLEFVYLYDDPADREVVGLIAACLAYGRVAQILKSVQRVLDVLGASPARTIANGRPARWRGELDGFAHRFAATDEIVSLLAGVQSVLRRCGSLETCFRAGLDADESTVLAAMGRFVDELRRGGAGAAGHLLCSPSGGSACKRLNLYLRWMVRNDEIDPGCWKGVTPSKLVVPLDTHMYGIGRATGAITRKSADAKAAMELTCAFAKIAPNDPVRFDFCLTRPGIRGEIGLEGIFGDAKKSISRRGAEKTKRL